MRNNRYNRHSKRNLKTFHKIEIILILLIIVFLIIFIKNLSNIQKNTTNLADEITQNSLNNENISEENSVGVDVQEQPQESQEEKDISFTMAVTGDIMCHNTMFKDAYNSTTKDYDFSYMFDDIKYYLQTADIAIGNLETTFAGSERGYSGYPTFNTPEILAKNLKKIGIDVVSTANNHSLDKGYSGLESTIQFLDEADLSHTGTFTSEEEQNTILIKHIKGINIAFLSFTYGTNGIPVPDGKEYCINLIDEDLILEQLNLAKEQNPDIICVSMHWGTEYRTTPTSEQEDLANFLFENGADIILGNHPHVLEPMEKREIKLENGETKEGFIVYSLGNFMADQNYKNTRSTAILELSITKSAETGKISIDSATYTPVYIYKDTSASTQKFKLLDIENTILAYEEGIDTSIGKTMYNTLVSELENIKEILGDEIV